LVCNLKKLNIEFAYSIITLMIYYILHSGKGLTIEKIMCEKDNVQFYNDKANINTLA